MSPISKSLPLENIKEGTPAAKETQCKTSLKNVRTQFYTDFSLKPKIEGSTSQRTLFYVTQRLETN